MENTKRCTKCKEQKNIEQFSKSKGGRLGIHSYCKLCAKTVRAKSYTKNKKLENEKSRKYKEKHKESIRAYSKEYQLKNKDRLRHKAKIYRSKNKHLHNAHENARRAKKLNATPKWLTKQQLAEMRDMYKQAKELETIFFNRKFHVDHIIPLNHPDVCGLHVPWNLQILTAEENLKKNNRLVKL